MQSTMFQPNILKLISANELTNTSPSYPCSNNPQNLIPQEVHSNSSLSMAIPMVMINDHNGSSNHTVDAQSAPSKRCANDHASTILANVLNLSFLVIVCRSDVYLY